MRAIRLWLRRNRDDVLRSEIAAHIDMDRADRIARGESPADADRNARVDFGNVGLVQELSRDAWAGAWLDRLWQDVKFGARMLRRTPAFTAMAIACLAVGIGSNAAVFSWVESILVRPYPGVADQDRLVAIAGTRKGASRYEDMSWPDYQDLARSSTLFSSFIVAKIIGANLTGGDRAERVAGQLVSANYFEALGVRPILGRGFRPEEEIGANAHPVTVISYRMWQDRFAGRSDVIGKTILFNQVAHTIVGVAPEVFSGTFVGYAMQFWVPASMQAAFNGTYMLDDRSARWIEGLARLAPDVTLAQAQAAMSTASKQLESQYPDVDRGRGVRVLPLWEAPFDNAKELVPMIRLSFIVVVLVLLIACANVANLLLVRSFARRHEMTVRRALGASREQLIRQLVIEGAMLSFAATLIGLLFAYWGRHALVLFFAPRGGVSLSFSVELDWRVIILSAVVGVVSTLIFALIPALRGSRVDLTSALKADSRTSGGGGSARFRAALVILQVAMSLVLLIGAGLLVNSLQRIRSANPGFRTDGLFTTRLGLLSAGYDTTRAKLFAREIVGRLEGVGGIDSVVLARTTPFDPSGPFATATIATDVYRPARDEQPTANYNAVTPGYFGTFGIPIVRGRDFTRADDDTTAPVAIVSESMAERYWPNVDPVGRRLQAGGRWLQVVGLVKDIKYQSLIKPSEPLFYVPMRQSGTTSFVLNARTRDGMATLGPQYLRVLRELDPNVVAFEIVSMREQVNRSTSTQRLASTFLCVFAAVALALAALGLYGVISYLVSQTTRELGLRMALGAEPSQVFGLVLSRGVVLTGIGMIVGLAVALSTTRLFGDLLYKVGPRDPVIFASALGVMLLTTLLACFVPAWRAATTNLVRALRA